MATIANVEQAEAWDGDFGNRWTTNDAVYQRALRHFWQALADSHAIRQTDNVLDIGCGTGRTTREAARIASQGSATGVDLSGQMLSRARELAVQEGLGNVEFVQADAQVHEFQPEVFDLSISRFGVMFFSDPVMAFTNIAAALRQDGRLAMVVWRRPEENTWIQVIREALVRGRDIPNPPPSTPGPFGLADPDFTRTVLEKAGFVDIDLERVDAMFDMGPTLDDAFEYASNQTIAIALLEELDPLARQGALADLKVGLAKYQSAEGILVPAGAWLVTAHR